MPPEIRSSSIPAKPEVIRWAREAARYSLADAAALLGLSQAQLGAIERGDLPLRVNVFSKMQTTYQQVESVLLRPTPPDATLLPKDYRTAGSVPTMLSRETLQVIREARRLQDHLTDLSDQEPELLPIPRVPEGRLSDDPAQIAQVERLEFGVNMTTQSGWAQGQAFDEWRSRVQKRGVAVLLTRMPWEDCRGLSLWEAEMVPMIVVNSEDSNTARSFTLFHEYAHLILRQSGICITEPTQTLTGQVERWCNAVAANLLMPSEDVNALVASKFPGVSANDWSIKEVRQLANQFRVSPYAMARRLKELRVTNFYDVHIRQLRVFDRRAKQNRTGSGGVRPEVQRLSEIGTGIAFFVLDAWKGDIIDAGTAADILRLRPDLLGKFEERAEEKRRRSA